MYLFWPVADSRWGGPSGSETGGQRSALTMIGLLNLAGTAAAQMLLGGPAGSAWPGGSPGLDRIRVAIADGVRVASAAAGGTGLAVVSVIIAGLAGRGTAVGGLVRGGGHRGLPGRVEGRGPAQHAVPGVPQGRRGFRLTHPACDRPTHPHATRTREAISPGWAGPGSSPPAPGRRADRPGRPERGSAVARCAHRPATWMFRRPGHRLRRSYVPSTTTPGTRTPAPACTGGAVGAPGRPCPQRPRRWLPVNSPNIERRQAEHAYPEHRSASAEASYSHDIERHTDMTMEGSSGIDP
jgi:hypothetical protein